MRTDFTFFSVLKTENPILKQKCANQKLFFLILVFCSSLLTNTFANPLNFRGEFNAWGTTVMAQKGAIMECRIQETATNAGRLFKFDNNGLWGSSWGVGATITKNSKFTAYNNGSNGLYASTNGNYYTFIIQNVADGTNASASVLETTYNPRSISSVTRDITTVLNSQNVTVSATLSGSLQIGEYCYLRYTTDSWATSSVVAMTTGSNPYTAIIPGQAVGKSIIYYCFTSNQATISTAADADYFTLELGNNNNANYNYTVTAGVTPTLSAATGTTVDAAFDVTFTDDVTWRAAITGITVGSTTLAAGAYTVSAGKITFTPSASTLLQSSGSKLIVVAATGYSNATVNQTIGIGADAKLAITTQPTAPASNGAVLAAQPVVGIQDQYGNTTASTANVVAAVGVGTWTLGGTATVAAVAGTATFGGLTATSAAIVNGATITFTSGTLTSVTSGTFNIPAPVGQIDWANLQYPGSGSIIVGGAYLVYAQVYKSGITPGAGQGAGMQCWIGTNTTDTYPSTWSESNWSLASYNSTTTGNNDEYKFDIGSKISLSGTYYYASRFQINSLSYVYGGYSITGGSFWDGTANKSGVLTVSPVTLNPSVNANAENISVSDNKLIVKFNGNKKVQLFNSIGETIYSGMAINQFTYTINKNSVYMLRINGQTHKVLVQ